VCPHGHYSHIIPIETNTLRHLHFSRICLKLAAAIGVMHQTWLDASARQRHPQRRQRQLFLNLVIQGPADYAAREGIQNYLILETVSSPILRQVNGYKSLV
jgi:hypothetical protein